MMTSEGTREMDLLRDSSFIRALLTQEVTVAIDDDIPLEEGMPIGSQLTYILRDIGVRLTSRQAVLLLFSPSSAPLPHPLRSPSSAPLPHPLRSPSLSSPSSAPLPHPALVSSAPALVIPREKITSPEITALPFGEQSIQYGRGAIRITDRYFGTLIIRVTDSGAPWSSGPYHSFGVIECETPFSQMIQGYNPLRREYYVAYRRYYYEFTPYPDRIVGKVTWDDHQGTATLTIDRKFTVITQLTAQVDGQSYTIVPDDSHYRLVATGALITKGRMGQLTGDFSLLPDL